MSPARSLVSHKIDDSTCADQCAIVRLHLLARSGLLCGSQHLVTRTPCATPTMTATIAAAISEDEPLQTGYVSFLFFTRTGAAFETCFLTLLQMCGSGLTFGSTTCWHYAATWSRSRQLYELVHPPTRTVLHVSNHAKEQQCAESAQHRRRM